VLSIDHTLMLALASFPLSLSQKSACLQLWHVRLSLHLWCHMQRCARFSLSLLFVATQGRAWKRG